MMVVTLRQHQYDVGEKPTVILYTYDINRHAESPNMIKYKTLQYIVKRIVLKYDHSAIEAYKKRGLGKQ